jgi:amino acid transporter
MLALLFFLTAPAFLMISAAAWYRLRYQPWADPAIVHVPVTGLSCLVGAVGCLALAWAFWGTPMPLALELPALVGAGGLVLGMWGSGLSILLTVRDIAQQPLASGLEQQNKRLRRVVQSAGRCLAEIEEETEIRAPRAPWLQTREA